MVDKGGLDYRIDVSGSFESVLQSFRTEVNQSRESWSDFKKSFTATAAETGKIKKAIASVTQENEKQRKSNTKTIEQRLKNISATKAEAIAIKQLVREAMAQEVALQKALVSRRIEFQIQRRRFEQVQQELEAEKKLSQVIAQRGRAAAREQSAQRRGIVLTDQERKQLKLLSATQLELLRVREQLQRQAIRLSPNISKLTQELATQKQLAAVVEERTRADRFAQAAKAKGIVLSDQELLGLRALTGAEKALAEARVRLSRSSVAADQRVVALNAQRQATDALSKVEATRARQAYLVQQAQKSGIKLTDQDRNRLGLLTEQEKALFNARRLREKATANNQDEVLKIRSELAAQKEVASILAERTRRELLLQAAQRQGVSITQGELNQKGLLKGAEKDLFEQEQKNDRLREVSGNKRIQQLRAEEIALKRIQQADIQRAAASNLAALGRTESGQLVTFRGRLASLVETLNKSKFASGQNVISFQRLLTVIGAFATFRTAIRLFKGFVNTIIDFNRVVETSTLGIGSLLTAVGEIRNATGAAVSATEALTLAQGVARDQLRLLRIDALKTAATFEQLVETFQVAVAPGLQAGLDVNQIRRFTIAVSQAAQAIDLPQNQLAEEIRSILEGTIQQRTTRIAVALGITNEDIRRAKELGVLAQFLEQRFAAFEESGKLALTTFNAIIANTQGALRLVIGSGGAEFFETLKTEIENFRQQLVTLNKVTGELEPNPRFVSAVKIIADSLRRAVIQARVFAAQLGFEDAEEGARNLAAIFDTVSKAVLAFVRGLLKGVEDVRKTFNATFLAVKQAIKSLGLEEAFSADSADDFLATLVRMGVVLTVLKTLLNVSLFNQAAIALRGLAVAFLAVTTTPLGFTIFGLASALIILTAAFIKAKAITTDYGKELLDLASDMGIFFTAAQRQERAERDIVSAIEEKTKAEEDANKVLKDSKANALDKLAVTERLKFALQRELNAQEELNNSRLAAIDDEIAQKQRRLALISPEPQYDRSVEGTPSDGAVASVGHPVDPENTAEAAQIVARINTLNAEAEGLRKRKNLLVQLVADQEGTLIELQTTLQVEAANPFDAAGKALNNFADQVQQLPGILLGVRGSLSDQAKGINELEQAYIEAAEARSQSERGLGVSGTAKSLASEQARVETEFRERTLELQKEQVETESKLLSAREQIRIATIKQVRLDEDVSKAIDKRIERLQKATKLQTEIKTQQSQLDLVSAGAARARKDGDLAKAAALSNERAAIAQEIVTRREELDGLTAAAAEDLSGVPDDQIVAVETLSSEKVVALGTEVALTDRLLQIDQDRLVLAEKITRNSVERQRTILQEALAEQKNQADISIAQAKAAVALSEAQKQGASDATLARIEQQGLLEVLELQTAQATATRDRELESLATELIRIETRKQMLAASLEEAEQAEERQRIEESLQATQELSVLMLEEINLKKAEGLAITQQETIELEKQRAILQLDEKREEEPVVTGIVEGLDDALQDSLGKLTDFKAQATSIISSFGSTVGGIISDALDPSKDVDIKQRFADFFRGIATQMLSLITTIAAAALVLAVIPGAKEILTLLAAAQGVKSLARGGKVPKKAGASIAHSNAPGYDTGGKIDPKARPKGLHPTDTVPIWAAPGEYMVRTKAVAKYGIGVLERINKGLVDASQLRAIAGISGTINRRPRGSSRQVGFAEGGPVVQRPSASTVSGTEKAGASGFQQAFIVADEQSMERLINGGSTALRQFMIKNKAILRTS